MDTNLAFEMNGGDDEDEALRRAIAMSMGETEPAGDGVQDETSNVNPKTAGHVDLTVSPRAKTTEPPTEPPTASSMLGLDRKKMEEERLARLKKRKTPDS